MTRTVNCCACGVEFGLSAELYDQRLRDHASFYCPNGHRQAFRGKTDQEKRIELLEQLGRRSSRMIDELIAAREQLLAAFKDCPIPGCEWRSRKQIPRDALEIGRGIERVRHDLLEHFVRDHAGRAVEPRQLKAAS